MKRIIKFRKSTVTNDEVKVSAIRRVLRAAGFWAVPVVIALLGLCTAYLNRLSWIGWIAVLAVVTVLAAMWIWIRRISGWARTGIAIVSMVAIVTVAIVIYPADDVPPAAPDGAAVTAPVNTQQGPVTGLRRGNGVEVFAGVPYAKPPVGDLRWKAPQPPVKRSEVLAADTFSPAPIQAPSTFITRALSQVIKIPLRDTFLVRSPTSEDSLYLNIWRSSTTADQGKSPVMVFVPGGGFLSGAGSLPVYDGANLAKRGNVIVVTINYRLGVFGFLSNPELAKESPDGVSGNYGILDQIAALQWVHDNIGSFGGDPSRVTVAGESAGGDSVCVLGATPLTKGLIHGIIGESGGCMGTAGDTDQGDGMDTRGIAEGVGAKLQQKLKVASLQELRDLPADKIDGAAQAFKSHWRPTLDGHVLPSTPREIYAGGKQQKVPFLLGSNANESSLLLATSPSHQAPDPYKQEAQEKYKGMSSEFLTLYPGDTDEQVADSHLHLKTDQSFATPMYRIAKLNAQTNKASVYLYYFNRVPPEAGLEKFGAYHGSELMYAYDNLGADGDATYTSTDNRLRDEMASYWVNFIRTGNPNSPGLPQWPKFSDAPEKVLQLGDTTEVIKHPRIREIQFWLQYPGPTS